MSRARSRQRRDEQAEILRFAEEIKESADLLVKDGANRGDIKLVARAVRELRDSFRLFANYTGRRKVTVFGSARTPVDDPHYQQAVAFGAAMAKLGYMVITGAGPGIMEAGHVGACAESSIGINIVLPFEQGANTVIDGDVKLINLNYFFTRKLLFLKEAHALVLFPGGFGTLDEGFEVLTMLQTGKSPLMPIVLVDLPESDYWERWDDYVDDCLLKKGMISEEDRSLYRIAHSVDDAVAEITRFYRIFHSQRFVRDQLVIRLHRPVPKDLMDRIQAEFADILNRGGSFKQGSAHWHEANESHLANLPRLFFPFNRRSHGRLRQLIDLLNREVP